MALPREPRQKMINIMYLVLTAILALNVSAEVINAFRVVDTSLTTSNKNLSTATGDLFNSLQEKMKDASSREKASYWFPKAQKAKALSDELTSYIENLKVELKKASGLRMKEKDGKQVEDFKLDALDASTRVFDVGGKGNELKSKLEKYKADILAIDPEVKKEFDKKLPLETAVPPSQEGTQKDFTQTYFHMTPTIAALTILSKFENNVKNSENQVVTFCHNQVGAVKIVYNKFEPIAVANSTYLMPGQEITMTAGVGAFNDQARPVVSYDGAVVALNEKGVAEKKFNVSGSGLHKTHVHITYNDPNTGKPASLDKDIEYTVGTPGGAAVMLDKMNVFYIGVDNPVTISSGTGWDKTHVSMTGGTISPAGTPGKFTVRVTTPGNATVSVDADKKVSSYPFRVKMIPNPVFKVGTSAGGRIQSVVFKNQPFCRADLENFEFDARFTVVSATVYFSGANFANTQIGTVNGSSLASVAQYIQRCGPGSSITFDNIKVKGPDGRDRTLTPCGFILF
jgi:gliding motility-associated protein GldM